MSETKQTLSNGDAFASYLEADSQPENRLIIDEGGALKIEGVLNYQEASRMLHMAIQTLDNYIQTAALPGFIEKSENHQEPQNFGDVPF